MLDYNLMPEAHPEDEITKLEWIQLLFDEEMHRVHLAINETKRRKKEEQENRIEWGGG